MENTKEKTMKGLKEILFENCSFWRKQYLKDRKFPDRYSFIAERSRARYDALNDVISEADLEEEYAKWEEQNNENTL